MRQGQGSPSVGPRGGKPNSTIVEASNRGVDGFGKFTGWNYQRPQLGSTKVIEGLAVEMT